MKNLITIIAATLILIGCSTDKPGGLVLNGNIENLKVGTVYLQKLQGATLVNLDSAVLNGNSKFTFTAAITEPQILYIYLDKKDATQYNDRVSFFATDTVMTFITELYNFEKAAVTTGGKNQELYAAFLKNTERLHAIHTDLIKRNLIMQSEVNPNPKDVAQLELEFSNYHRKKVLYGINYANTYRSYEIAPFLLLQEAEDANPKIIDSIFKLMPKKIQTSLYGKELSEFLKKS